MPTVIRGLEVDEISLVDDGANAGAKVTLYKRGQVCKECGKPMEMNKAGDGYVCKGCGAETKMEKGMPTPGQVHTDAMPGEKKDKAKVVVEDEDEEDGVECKKAAEPRKENDMEQVEKLQADLTALTAERDELKKRLDAIENTPEAIEKRKLEAVPEDIRKRLVAAEEAVTKMREDAETKEWIEKAREIGEPIDPLKVGPILKRVSKEDREELQTVLKALAEQVKKSQLFGEVGSSRTEMPSSSAYAEITKRAQAIVEKDPTQSLVDAEASVCKADPALYERHIAEQRRVK